MNTIVRSFLVGVAAAAVTAPVFAADMVTEIGEAEGEVNIVAWPGYIERGETMKEFDWVTKYEEATGCMVKVKTANTSDDSSIGDPLSTTRSASMPASIAPMESSPRKRLGPSVRPCRASACPKPS